MESIEFFKEALKSFLEQSKALEPEVHEMSKLLFGICEIHSEYYLNSEFLRKPT